MTRIRKRGPVDPAATRPKKVKPGGLTLAQAHDGTHHDPTRCAACQGFAKADK